MSYILRTFSLLSVCLFNDRELKDNLGSDDPEGDIPVLLQAVLARNPNVFREKSMQNRYGVQSGESSYSIIFYFPSYKLYYFFIVMI